MFRNENSLYSEKSKSYRNYVLSKYGEAIVVFDGYDVASTKDLIHNRCPLVTFTPEMCLTSTKELFLSIKQNKQKFICVLGDIP